MDVDTISSVFVSGNRTGEVLLIGTGTSDSCCTLRSAAKLSSLLERAGKVIEGSNRASRTANSIHSNVYPPP